jgi:peptidoglycan L-alanyl-D-glutamate endopeptidase CwlK
MTLTLQELQHGIRDLKELNPLVDLAVSLAMSEMKHNGIEPLVTETFRPQERQNYLYCQGRTIDECVAKGIDIAFATKYCNTGAREVTWTLDSVHTSKKAVDLIPQRDGKAIYDVNDSQTRQVIAIMTKYGFEAGANWKSNKDSPHFQMKGNFSTSFSKEHTTKYVTMAIQTALNKRINAGLKVDGAWGDKTTKAVNDFREKMKYSAINGAIGMGAYVDLMK